jgi:hypothetical protein
MKTHSYSLTSTEVLADPAASDWLKVALKSAVARDPIDALNDALLLAAILEDNLRTRLEIVE